MDRRGLIIGGLASVVASGVRAAPEPQAFTDGPLANSPGAQRFQAPPPGLALPSTPLVDAHGKTSLSALRDKKIRLVSLWAEWCAPCIAEMADLTVLNARYAARGFEVLAVLTASKSKLDYASAAALLERKGAVLPLWVEPGGGDQVFEVLSKRDGQGSLSCNILVDQKGLIRGRSFGAALLQGEGPRVTNGVQLSEQDKAKLSSGNLRTVWSTEATHQFVEQLLAGALDG